MDLLSGCKAGLGLPPFIPRVEPQSVQRLCQLALDWYRAGRVKQAGQLAHWLLPLSPFHAFWCPEKQYQEHEARLAFARLCEIEPLADDWPRPDPYMIQESPSIASVWTLSGRGTSLGMICGGGVEIRALGPQSGSLQFGIEGSGFDGWTRCAFNSEVWMEVKPTAHRLDLRFVGLGLDPSCSFVFYAKAQSCEVGDVLLAPQSLRRFSGEVQRVRLDRFVIESSVKHKVHVIPLAGKGCFWDCEFLVSFEIHPLAPQASFVFIVVD